MVFAVCSACVDFSRAARGSVGVSLASGSVEGDVSSCIRVQWFSLETTCREWRNRHVPQDPILHPFDGLRRLLHIVCSRDVTYVLVSAVFLGNPFNTYLWVRLDSKPVITEMALASK